MVVVTQSFVLFFLSNIIIHWRLWIMREQMAYSTARKLLKNADNV